MPKGLSLYLDVVRLFAAIVVLLTHLAYRDLSGGQLEPWRSYGNDAVMVFFVLSGFVIAHTVESKPSSLRQYAVDRLARLWSVAIPALVLTLVLDQVGRWFNPLYYDAFWYRDSVPLMRALAAATFTNELWFSSVRPFSNGPYWSLGYEAWYYAIFGAWTFLSGRRRLMACLILAFLAGPKVWLLAPAWILGVLTFRETRSAKSDAPRGIALMAFSTLGYVLFRASGAPAILKAFTFMVLGEDTYRLLHFSDEFLSSLVIAPLVALHFRGALQLSPQLQSALWPIQSSIRMLAGTTFAIYLIHYPVLRFISAVTPYDRASPGAVALVFSFTLAICVAVGVVIEPWKQTIRLWINKAISLAILGLRRDVERSGAQ